MNLTQEQVNQLRLIRSHNIGRASFFSLIEQFGSATEAIAEIENLINKGQFTYKIKLANPKTIDEEISKTYKFGAQIIFQSQESYSSLLLQSHDSPPAITVKGNINLLNQPTFAIVGSRNASFNSVSFTKKIALQLSSSFVIVSGLARGIDGAAHIAAIEGGTIAVIAGGINNVYPKENSDLYKRISDHGLIVCEQAFDSPPIANNFIKRNRIISGLSNGVLVVEAGIKSGSLTTARFAGEQGREVFAVPGSPIDARSSGCNKLIKEGAKMVEDVNDIFEEFNNLIPPKLPIKKIAKSVDALIIKKSAQNSDLNSLEKEIISKLSNTPIAIEELNQNLDAPINHINIALVKLEMANKIEVSYGKINLRAKLD